MTCVLPSPHLSFALEAHCHDRPPCLLELKVLGTFASVVMKKTKTFVIVKQVEMMSNLHYFDITYEPL